jgi:3-oxoadipate enol-lactonase/4-carboxymuconolactone decarboxylase
MYTNYKISGTPNSPVLVFSNSLGADYHMWDELIPFLLPYFRVVQYDTRGLGKSEATPEPYTIDLLGNDVIQLLNELKINEAYFCGLSMGGLIGQWLALHHPERIKKIVISNSAAKIGDAERWNSRIATVNQSGTSVIADEMMERWFTDQYRQSHPDRVSAIKNAFLSTDPLGYTNNCAAIREADFRQEVKKITIPTLIITGDADPVTTVEHAQYLHSEIKGSALKILPAKHLSATELPEQFAHTMLDFLVGNSVFEKGMHIRKSVLGATHVENSLNNINAFNEDFQRFISTYAWGEVWSRPGLSKAQRSMITISMLVALNKPVELKMHLRAAIHNGLSVHEIKEILLHSALYCGLPAANEANHLAESVFNELNLNYK